jgi:hypothetical protein
MDDAFAFLHELLDEMAQTKFFGVDLGHQGAFPWDARSMNAAILPVRHDTDQQQGPQQPFAQGRYDSHTEAALSRHQDVSAARRQVPRSRSIRYWRGAAGNRTLGVRIAGAPSRNRNADVAAALNRVQPNMSPHRSGRESLVP